jgi:hypothetical protein
MWDRCMQDVGQVHAGCGTGACRMWDRCMDCRLFTLSDVVSVDGTVDARQPHRNEPVAYVRQIQVQHALVVDEAPLVHRHRSLHATTSSHHFLCTVLRMYLSATALSRCRHMNTPSPYACKYQHANMNPSVWRTAASRACTWRSTRANACAYMGAGCASVTAGHLVMAHACMFMRTTCPCYSH